MGRAMRGPNSFRKTILPLTPIERRFCRQQNPKSNQKTILEKQGGGGTPYLHQAQKQKPAETAGLLARQRRRERHEVPS